MEKIPTYVISLDQAREKFNTVSRDFQEVGVQVKRFPAVYGKSLTKEELQSLVHPYALYTLQQGRRISAEISTIGAIGCSLSHIRLWEQFLNSGEDAIHVLEDDAIISVPTEKINAFIKSIPEDWDVIYLGFSKSITDQRRDIKVSEGVYKIDSNVALTHSYIINQRGAEKLLSRALPIIHAVDAYMPIMAMYGGLNAYRPSEQYITQKASLFSQVGLDFKTPFRTIKDCLMINITNLPPSIIILSFFIALFVVISFLIKKVAKLVR